MASTSTSTQKASKITGFLVTEAMKLGAASLPDEVLDAARNCVLDWLGVTIAGAGEPLVRSLIEAAREQGGLPQSTVVWHGEKTSHAFAALINGSASDALDFADSNPAMRGHSTPAVVATALAMSEWRNASGMEFLRAIVCGIESECRVGLMVKKGLRPGWHPTANIAPFGAAAAAAYLRGLDAVRWGQALSIVATQAAGLHNSGGTMSKPFHSGKAAMNGVLSASLAEHGFTGRPDAIEASEGFLSTRSTEIDEKALYASAGRYLILDTAFKSQAACGLTHDTIDNMLQLKREQRLAAEDVARIEIEVPTLYLRVCNIQEPATGLQAKFSLRATAAMVLLGDDTTDIGAYTDQAVTRPELARLRDRIRVQGRDDLKCSVALVELVGGRRFTVRSDERKPSRDTALVRSAVSKKFLMLVAPLLGNEAATELRQTVLGVDRLDSVRTLLALSARGQAA
jgi:2-methylcitrate dehydratase PrpD